MSASLARRSLVVVAAVLALFGGLAAIRVAAAWTAASGPLLERPPAAEEIVGELQLERAHHGALQAQLGQIEEQAAQLRNALETASERASTDEATATELAAQLAVAEARLAELRARLAAMPPATTVVQVPAAAPAATAEGASGEHEGGDDHEHDGGEDDD